MDNNDDKIKFGSDSTPKMDDNYFDNLYDDLPKEIADLLKSNHPFVDHDDGEETFEEKRARRAAMRKETKGSRREQSARGSRREIEREERAEKYEEKAAEKQEERIMPEKFDIFKDDLDLTPEPVEAMSKAEEKEAKAEPAAEEKPKTPLFDESAIIRKAMEEANISAKGDTEEDKAIEAVAEEEAKEIIEDNAPEDDVKIAEPHRRAERRKKKEDKYDDYEVDDKEEALARFFNDSGDDYYDEKGGAGKAVLVILLIIAIGAAGFLGYKYVGAKSNLAQANAKLEQVQDSEAEKEDLKLQILDLQSQIDKLEAEKEQTQTTPTADPAALENPGSTSTEITPATTSETAERTYTVVDGDSYWAIAQKVYGDGTKYQKILDANGLKENDSLSIGQTLKIPSL